MQVALKPYVSLLAYIPYGETLLDLSDSTGYQTPHQFAGYEKDQESGLSYATARYYSARRSIFTSVDPMWAARPWESSYSYCGNNPIMRIDPSGMIWDESQLTESQRAEWQKNVQKAREGGSLFKTMYDQLSNSEEIYYVNVDPTLNNASGQFNADNNTISFSDESEMGKLGTISEEIFHAYQKDNKSLYLKGKAFNFEFEAKVAKLLITYENGSLSTLERSMQGFVDFVNSTYGYHKPLTQKQVNSPLFQSEYMKKSEVFRNYNILNNHGNSNYRKKTEQTPKSLLKLFEKHK